MAGLLLYRTRISLSVWSLTVRRMDQLVQQNWPVTQICIPIPVIDSLGMQVILKGSPPLAMAGLLVFYRTRVRIYVWSLTTHGMDQLVQHYGQLLKVVRGIFCPKNNVRAKLIQFVHK